MKGFVLANAHVGVPLSLSFPVERWQGRGRRRRATVKTSLAFRLEENGSCKEEGNVWCRTITLGAARTLEEAAHHLQSSINHLKSAPPAQHSGLLRIEVPLLQDIKALEWLQSQPQSSALLPRCYFSPRQYQGSIGESLSKHISKRQLGQPYKKIVKGVAGIGSAVLFKSSHPFSLNDWKTIRRFLSEDSPLIRAYGVIRFDSRAKPSQEWEGFGSFYFVIPQMELDECEGSSILAATIAWDHSLLSTFNKAINALELTLGQVSSRIRISPNMYHLTVINKGNTPDEKSWNAVVQKALNMIESSSARDWKCSRQGNSSFFDMRSLRKVILARRSKIEIDANIDPLELVACLQETNQNSYQFCFELPNLSAFIGSTPERLFYRSGSDVSSEAVAGTRARGRTIEEDLQIGLDLLHSFKDQYEFDIVKETIKHQMETVCERVIMESRKCLIKQARVQHLCARFIGELKKETDDIGLLSLLHPTPAVCGYPRESALDFISQNEMFDRGMYAGPVGWFGGNETEFAVGIRSALIQQNNSISSPGSMFPKGTCLYLYAGAGIVNGSMPSSEWQELNLKASQFEALIHPGHAMNSFNINAVRTSLMVDK
ncbi:isochorismate synthase, chloroplastic isoform X3 [Cryptomeria japonica]|uniref:isochorismate synthase, chloroplastic isoform X3 n=1 Tax=Cryptomeria japonica TaxID=3369 RepID=UPI0025AD069A|nr:isochorismate synthase, chloroplastic isoform X3 [Cryptomeria japonica]